MKFGLYCIFFAFLTLSTMFSTVPLPAIQYEFNKENDLKIVPENYVNIVSKLIFSWCNNIIYIGYKRKLNREDLWRMETSESSDYNMKRLEYEWKKSADEYIKNKRKNKDPAVRLKKPSLSWALIKAYYGKFLGGSCLRVVKDLANFVGPVVLDRIIRFLNDRDQNINVGILYALLLFFSSTIQSLVQNQCLQRYFIVGARLRSSIINIFFKKVIIIQGYHGVRF